MHEAGLLRAAVAELCEAVEGPVSHVTLDLGPGVDREAAGTAWRVAAQGTLAADADVTWHRGRDRLACLSCGADYDGDAITRCPDCGGDGLVTEPAPEIAIAGFRVPGGRPVGLPIAQREPWAPTT